MQDRKFHLEAAAGAQLAYSASIILIPRTIIKRRVHTILSWSFLTSPQRERERREVERATSSGNEIC